MYKVSTFSLFSFLFLPLPFDWFQDSKPALFSGLEPDGTWLPRCWWIRWTQTAPSATARQTTTPFCLRDSRWLTFTRFLSFCGRSTAGLGLLTKR